PLGQDLPRIAERNVADEARVALRHLSPGEAAKQAIAPILIGRVGAGEAGRLKAGPAVEDVDLQTGVVGEGDHAALPGECSRFDPSVRRVRRAGLRYLQLQAQIRWPD